MSTCLSSKRFSGHWRESALGHRAAPGCNDHSARRRRNPPSSQSDRAPNLNRRSVPLHYGVEFADVMNRMSVTGAMALAAWLAIRAAAPVTSSGIPRGKRRARKLGVSSICMRPKRPCAFNSASLAQLAVLCDLGGENGKSHQVPGLRQHQKILETGLANTGNASSGAALSVNSNTRRDPGIRKKIGKSLGNWLSDLKIQSRYVYSAAWVTGPWILGIITRCEISQRIAPAAPTAHDFPTDAAISHGASEIGSHRFEPPASCG